MAKVSVMGAGSWGLGLAILLNNNGHDVKVWSVFPEEIKVLDKERENKKCLPGVHIPEKIEMTADTEYAVNGADVIVLAVASPYTRSTAKLFAPFVKEGQYVVNVGKGIEESTLMTLCQVVEEEIPAATVAVLSGPSHAEEVGRLIPTTCVIGTHKRKDAEYLQNIFMSDVFRVYISPDMLGICIGGALKNVIALAAGIADGLGYGDNTKAALITRGIAEISRLGTAMGANPSTFSGLSGIGDLIVTCASMHSRNRRAGILIGQGKTMVSPMHNLMIISSIANRGVMMQPYFVEKVQTRSGDVVSTTTPKQKSVVCTPSEADTIGEFCRAVVTEGTGYAFTYTSYTVAGKTGTAQFDNSDRVHSWFIGYAPYENPQISFCVILEGGYTGVPGAQQVTKALLDAFFDEY
mgnify:CR=1 FL=1